MVYMGSKSKIAKDIVPIIESYLYQSSPPSPRKYIEPFVGGANIIDKINFPYKRGYDINKYLIALLSYIQDPNNPIPDYISEERYQEVRQNKDKYEDWEVGLVGFCATFGGKFFGGYGRNDRIKGISISTSRIKNLQKQRNSLKDIEFIHSNYRDIDISDWENYVIYCDPPYKGTTSYASKGFDYSHFYDWCVKLAQNNTVLVSEYNIDHDKFSPIWEKEIISPLKLNNYNNKKEKLYMVRR